MKLLFALFMFVSFEAFAQSKKDTLEIPKHIKVIVIDGEVFEVIRKVELKKSESIQFLPRGFGWGSGGYITPLIMDTISINRNKFYLQYDKSK